MVEINDTLGPIGILSMNHLFPPFNDVRARRAILAAISQEEYMHAFVGTEQAYFYRAKGQKFFRIATTGLYPHSEALAFSDKSIAQAVADALNKMKADGSFDKLFGSYHHCTLPPPFEIRTGPIHHQPNRPKWSP